MPYKIPFDVKARMQKWTNLQPKSKLQNSASDEQRINFLVSNMANRNRNEYRYN